MDTPPIPEAVIPRSVAVAQMIEEEATKWWTGLTPAQRVGLWIHYRPAES